jgi:hypothetical protein
MDKGISNGGRHKKMIFQTCGDTIWVGVKIKDMDEFVFTRLNKKRKY